MSEEKLGVGIVGAGAIALLHAQAYSTIPSTKIVGIADLIEERAEGLARKFNAKECYTDYKKMLRQSEVQIVSVCTPPWTHKGIVLDAIDAGKHVLCEKPMALSLRDANEMVAAAKNSGLKLGIDFQNRYLPQHQKAKKLLDENLIGKLFQIRCRVGYPILQVLPPDAPMREWLFDRDRSGGGVLMDFGSHWIDLARWFVGDEVNTVSALYSSQEIKSVEDNAMVLCEFENGVQALIDISWTQKGGFNFVELYGRNGTIVCNGPQPIMIYTEKESLSQSLGRGWIHPQLEPADEPHKCLIKDFVKSVESGTNLFVSGEDGRSVQEIITAAYESYRTRSVTKLPL